MFSCSNPEAFIRTPPAAYNLMGQHKLPITASGILYWHIVNFSTDLEPHHQVSLLAKVFSAYQQYLYPWRFEPTSNAAQAEWKIYFATDNKILGEPSPYDFNKAPGTLAVQYAYYPGFKWSLCCIVNDAYFFGLAHSGNTKDLFKILLHEMGHGFRLGHTDASGDIMYPTYDPDNEFTQDSINGLWDAHGEHLGEYVNNIDASKRFLDEFGGPKVDLAKNPGCLW